MREILFKAKRIDNGEWIEGSLINLDIDSGYCYIVPPYKKASILPINFLITDRMELVDSKTLCQFTGLYDKNGKRIWENDIVFVTDENDCSGQISTGIGNVIFIEGMWYIDGRPQEGLYDINKVFQIEVIGNAFDNQELLQEEENE